MKPIFLLLLLGAAGACKKHSNPSQVGLIDTVQLQFYANGVLYNWSSDTLPIGDTSLYAIGRTSRPGGPPFTEVHTLFAFKEIYTGDSAGNAFELLLEINAPTTSPLGGFGVRPAPKGGPHYVRCICAPEDTMMTFRQARRHFLFGGRVIWGRRFIHAGRLDDHFYGAVLVII
jgi:hypothetical protein